MSKACAIGHWVPGARISHALFLAKRRPPRRYLSGREPPVPFQRVPIVPVPKVGPTVPYTSEPSAVAEAASQKRAHDALFGAENEQLALKSIPAKASKPKPTAQLPSARKKVITEVRKRRFARRGGDRGLGLFALSGDFGRRQGY